MHIISRPTRREAEANRQEALARAGRNPSRWRGTARTVEEAQETQRNLTREGEEFNRLWDVSDDSPDAKQAHIDLSLREGIDPETGQLLHRR